MALIVSDCTQEKYDIVIKNATICDGTGNEPYGADIGITDGIIKTIGKNMSKGGAVEIDAARLFVSPGFIDIHTHCDDQILNSGMNNVKNYLTQGVTTLVTGNCGDGAYDVNNYFRILDSIGTGPNIVHLTGHNTIRKKVMGMENREPTTDELKEMARLVRMAMEGGAAGISTGLFYTPGAYSKTDEIVQLAAVVKEYSGFYATHLRDESDYNVGLEEAVKEAIQIGEQTGIRVEISHIKALGKPVWGMSEKICTLIEGAKGRGVHIFADQYPYNASSTSLVSVVVPSWVSVGGKLESRLNDKTLLPKIISEIDENIERRGGPESLVVVSFPKDNRFDGKSLSEISNMTGKSPAETAIYLILEDSPSIISFNMQDSDIANYMKKDYVMTCSDGHVEVPGDNKPHPRNYGTFTRKIRKYVIEDKLISMEHAVRAATSLPAEMIGLKDRGCIKEGNIADIVIFDPENVRDMATYENPHQYSKGIEYLLINGEVVISKGVYNGKLAGKPLRINNL